jgi:hypothetical protein
MQKMNTATEQKSRPPGGKFEQIHMESDGEAQSPANHGISQFIGKMKVPRQDPAPFHWRVTKAPKRGNRHARCTENKPVINKIAVP